MIEAVDNLATPTVTALDRAYPGYDVNGEYLAETDSTGNILLEYLYLNGQILAAYTIDDDQNGVPNIGVLL